MRNSLIKKFDYLNLKMSPSIYYLFKWFTTLLLFFVLVFVNYGYILAPIFAVVYYFMFDIILLDMNINNRKFDLESDALVFFDVFLLSLKGTKNIRKSLEITCESVNNNISKEIYKMLKDIKYGRTFDESMSKLIDTIPSEIICNILISIREASRTGNKLNDSVSVQLELLKERRDKNILTKYKLIPLSMFIVFLIFIFLILCIILLFKFIV